MNKVLIFVLGTSLMSCVPSAAKLASSQVPYTLAPPSGNVEFLRALGQGVQIYTCTATVNAATAGTATAGGAAWTLKAPEALLKNAQNAFVADHGAGPSWTAPDGSRVTGTRLANAPSPNPAAIPWLLLEAKASGAGLFGSTSYIQRLDTVGGVAPSSGCTPSSLNVETRVPYSATYVFFKNVFFKKS